MVQAEPPQLLQVVREPINAGDEARYEEIENETAAACVALKCPHPHLALETLTGPKEIWWFNFFESEEQRLQVTRDYERNRPLMAVLTRNSARKSRYTGQITDQILRYRPDPGRGVWDLPGARYTVVTFGDPVLDAGGPVFEGPDGTHLAIRFFRTLEDAQQLAQDEILMRYRVRNGRLRFASNGFFFREGTGDLYQDARYGMFRVDARGELLLTHLCDENLRPLGNGI